MLFFAGLALRHEFVIRRKTRAGRAVCLLQESLARLEDRWAGEGEAGDRFRSSIIPTLTDLDLFGNGGLFQLLSTAKTRMGEKTLANWLLDSAFLQTVANVRPPSRICVTGWIYARTWRCSAKAGRRSASRTAPEMGGTGASVDSRPARVVLACCRVFWWFSSRATFKCLGVAAPRGAHHRGNLGFLASFQGETSGGERRTCRSRLGLLADVLSRLEREMFQASRLNELQKLLDTQGVPPSQQIARLKRLVELLDSRRNIFMRVIGPPLFYTTQLAFAVEAWRKSTGPQVGRVAGCGGRAGSALLLGGLRL